MKTFYIRDAMFSGQCVRIFIHKDAPIIESIVYKPVITEGAYLGYEFGKLTTLIANQLTFKEFYTEIAPKD